MKKVLLFSGGLDCFLIYKLFGSMDLLYIRHGNSYEESELESINKLFGLSSRLLKAPNILGTNNFHSPGVNLTIDNSLNLYKFEKESKIIDNRNLLFVTIAANYGYDEILIGSVEGDNSKDQNEPFFNDVSYLLSSLNNREVKVTAPAKQFTKADLIKMYIERGFSADDLFKSYSCYGGTLTPCGRCKPCIRKWVAMEHNNIDTSKYFQFNPIDSEYFKGANLELIKSQQWRGVREDNEILNVLRKKKSIL